MSSPVTLCVAVEINNDYVEDVRRFLGGLPGVRRLGLTHYEPNGAWQVAAKPQLLIYVEDRTGPAEMALINTRITELWRVWKGYVAMRMCRGMPQVPNEYVVWPQPSPSSSERTGDDDGSSAASA